MTTINLQIDTINLLHQWLPFDAGVLFPFGLGNESASGRIEAMLTKGGFLTQEGKISDSAREMFSIISQTKTTSKLRFLVEGDLLDYQIFFADNKAVALKRSENGFSLTHPAPNEEIIDVISDFSGMGSFGTVPAQWHLSFHESKVLATIIDVIRRQIFTALGKDEEQFEVSIKEEEIAAILDRDDLNANWLVWAINSFIPVETSLSNNDIAKAILSLTEKNLIKKDGQCIIACDQLLIASRRLLHLTCLYLVDKFSVKSENDAEKSRFSVIQNGIRDLLMLETDGKSIAWQGISGKVLLSLLESSLNIFDGEADKAIEPEQVPSPKGSPPPKPPQRKPVAPPPPVEKTSPSVCPKCTKPLKANARFCTKCGETIS